MTDCQNPDEHHGLGGLPSPPDARDFPVSDLYALRGVDAITAPPPAYNVPAPLYPVLNQGSTPQCVAYSAAGEQGWYDLRDQGMFNFDTATFFRAIGGTDNGAVIRDAFKYRLATGYPAIGSPASFHRIAAYYAVPTDKVSIQSAIQSFGPNVLGTPWFHSWFHPVAGVLPAPDYQVGGHAIQAVGWNTVGLRLRNSWGSSWGSGGEAVLPWAYLSNVREAWKAVDAIEATTGGDMAISSNLLGLSSGYVIDLAKGQPFYATPSTDHQVTTLGKAGPVTFMGTVVGAPWFAVLVNTGGVYPDGKIRTTIVYVPQSAGTQRKK